MTIKKETKILGLRSDTGSLTSQLNGIAAHDLRAQLKCKMQVACPMLVLCTVVFLSKHVTEFLH